MLCAAGTQYDVGTNTFDTSAKQRVPSWTDRILWKTREELRDRVEGRYVAGGSKIAKARFVDLDALAQEQGGGKKKFGGGMHGGSGRKDKGVKNAKREAALS